MILPKKSANLGLKVKSTFSITFLIASLFLVYYVVMNTASSSLSLIAFIGCDIVLFILNPVYAFVYSFVLHVDVMGSFTFKWVKLLTFVSMYFVFFFNPNALNSMFKDKKIKSIFYLSIIFGLYLIFINIGIKSGLTTDNLVLNIGYYGGFLTIMPAYYFTQKQPKTLFKSFSLVAAIFLIIYFLNIIKGYDLFNSLTEGSRNEESTITRYSGYIIREFVIFFTYLIPAAILSKHLKFNKKVFLFLIGVFSYLVIVLAIYRLAMFYVAMGTILAAIFISKYVKWKKIFTYIFLTTSIIVFVFYFFSQSVTAYTNILSWTYNSFLGKETDVSANIRFLIQAPKLIGYIESNFLTGIGFIEMKSMEIRGFYGFVDFPILSTLGAFGIIGMTLYYSKFIVLLIKPKYDLLRNKNIYQNKDNFEFYLYLTLKAYIITMITFRLFFISWELTFDFLQADFGLLAGIYLALERSLNNYRK